MWQFGTCSSYYPNGVSICLFIMKQHKINKHRFDSNIFEQATWKTRKKNFFCEPKFCQPVQGPSLFPNMILQFTNICSTFSPWPCKGIFSNSSHFGTIFSRTHILQHHLNSHHITPWIKWLLPIFFQKLRAKPRPWAFFWFLQVNILMHAAFINKWPF